jgi:dienelactone hydrolase
VSHGFAVRFDAKEQVAKKSAEDAKDQVVAFFGKYLV